MIGREPSMVGEKPYMVVVGMRFGIRRANTVEEDREKKESLWVDGCQERIGLVP
jgi:hypothetical protein